MGTPLRPWGTSYKKGLLLSLGSVIQTSVDVYTVIPKQRSGLNRICPEHKQQLRQQMYCEEGQHVCVEFVLAEKTPTGWIIPKGEKQEVEAAEALTLTPVPASELDDNTVLGESFYYLTPTHAASLEAWQVMVNILKKGKIALVAKAALRSGGNEKLWRLGVFRDHLVMNELVYPDTIREIPELPSVKVTKQVATLVDQFVENLMTSWDKFDTTNTPKQRLDEWLSSGTTVESVHEKEGTPATGQDLMEALKAAVEASK